MDPVPYYVTYVHQLANFVIRRFLEIFKNDIVFIPGISMLANGLRTFKSLAF